ncbi:HNH endonuclease signature motif containing protein [Streptomyces sp. NPDC005863]|uniref:HNH endonuclease signature motif containing protein n=1 Tax=Streptomyces sp. NPDC005863 TaxID=3364735 RepID=UPI0036AFA29A
MADEVVDPCAGRQPHGKWCCARHYVRWTRRGTVQPPQRATLQDRFWSKVRKAADSCWVWTASSRNGYGTIGTADGKQYAHRLSYVWHHGPIAEGLVVRHRCDNPLCVRPDHLELGTKADNSRDMVERGRSPRNSCAANTHCPNGHPFDESNTYWHQGSRQCRACKSEYDRRRRVATGAAARSNRLTGNARAALSKTAAERYLAGETLKEIAASVGRSTNLIRNLLAEAGVEIRPKSYRRRSDT